MIISFGNAFVQANEIGKLRSEPDLKLSDSKLQSIDIKSPEPIMAIDEKGIKNTRTEQTAYISGQYVGMILMIKDKEVRVDNRLPKGLECGDNDGVNIVCEKGIVKKIIVKSRRVHLDRTYVAVGNKLEDIIRYYGKSDQVDVKDDKFISRYKSRGVDFEMDKEDKKIIKIIVYVPIRTLPVFGLD